MFEAVVEKNQLLSPIVLNQYKTQEMCDRHLTKEPKTSEYASDQ